MPSKFLNISTDNTLGGNSPSDVVVSSQKAIKEYVDSHGGGGSTAIDNLSIAQNSSLQIQTVGVIDSNNTTNAIKTWTGTRQQYDAIQSKDANTEYFCTDTGELYLGTVKIGGADLNGKADTSLSNITSAGKAVIVHNAMPSGVFVDNIFTSPITTTGQTYTAPADGYVMVGAVGTGKAINLTVDGKQRFYQYVNAGHSYGDYTPVRKGQEIKVYVSYGGGSATLENSYFEYAMGAV